MGINRIRDLVVHTLNNEYSTSFNIEIYGVIWGLQLTREIPPGECGRKVKLKGIDGDLYKGWRCGLIRIPRKTLPIFVLTFSCCKITGYLYYDINSENVGVSMQSKI